MAARADEDDHMTAAACGRLQAQCGQSLSRLAVMCTPPSGCTGRSAGSGSAPSSRGAASWGGPGHSSTCPRPRRRNTLPVARSGCSSRADGGAKTLAPEEGGEGCGANDQAACYVSTFSFDAMLTLPLGPQLSAPPWHLGAQYMGLLFLHWRGVQCDGGRVSGCGRPDAYMSIRNSRSCLGCYPDWCRGFACCATPHIVPGHQATEY